MSKYVVRRLLLFIPVWLGVAVLTFFMMHLIPGNPAEAVLGNKPMTNEALKFAEHQMGLDRPLWVQLSSFLWNAIHGNMGESWQAHVPVMDLIRQRLPYTVELAFFGLLIGSITGVTMGVAASVLRGTVIDNTLLVLSLMFVSFPGFWLALMLIWVFAVWLQWLPVAGAQGWKALILPVFVLASGGAPVFLRLTRASMLEVLQSDYVRTARAKGLSNRVVVFRHALRNALNSIITIIGLSFGSLLGGAFIVEQVFSRPGLGTLAVQAIMARDYPIIQGIVLYTATIFLVLNLVIDIGYAFIDPRIQYE